MIGFHNFCSTIRPSRAIHRVNAHMLSHKIDLHDFREKLHNCKAKYTFNGNKSSNITFDSFSESLEVVETTGYVVNNRIKLRKTRVHDGTISLTTSDNREYDQIAISFAMINAVKLNYLELDITNALELKNNALNELVNVVKSHKLDRLARTLFDLETRAHNCRYRLNLQQDLLEYPDVLWDYDKQCDLFNRVQITFDIPKRLDNLNHRLSSPLYLLN
ncbi:uncharacterized protein TOT_040000163 [Theileria orientalis strain Shintoku]|uniref:DUF155 domain-containing protein n=1 Tax=Theileria orientalis strain Shintoku TaxID=869250 RepID=J4C492_THEOR|nr:uncharacterized protein TOT_040000163 [Theileria orientalis strain Shintoku]BAM41781.1 uncharacterized protein TOT_040000163 [Theileria orientalis strain Shintoku]|eukprot:XP_009692082.1 uncharacterized protein TOT_040000163 [Theileria orientalis strain Shintoku]